MRGKLKKGVEDVKANGAAVRQKVSRGQQEYLETLAELLWLDRMSAVVRSVGGSDKAMKQLAQSPEAMNRLAQSDAAIENLVQSDAAMQKLAQSDAAMQKLAQSDEAMKKLGQSDEAIARLAQSDETMLKLLGPELFARWKAQQNPPAE